MYIHARSTDDVQIAPWHKGHFTDARVLTANRINKQMPLSSVQVVTESERTRPAISI